MRRKSGSIEVVCGPMFAGKSSELLRLAKREMFAKKVVRIFTKDKRYLQSEIQTHDGRVLPISHTFYVEDNGVIDYGNASVVCIDEGQFFGPTLATMCRDLMDQGIRVIVSCLDMDSEGVAFENVSQLLGIATHISKLTAVCVDSGCEEDATMTYRSISSEDRYLQGSEDIYIPLCYPCWVNRRMNGR
jgi:thymidine kinase